MFTSHRKRLNIFNLTYTLENTLRKEGIPFNTFNYPDFRQFDFPQSVPSDCEMLPFRNRHRAFNKKKTIICFNSDDPTLYSYLPRLDDMIDECKRDYYAICGFDLSICGGTDLSEQSAYLLADMLVTGYALVRGARVIPNWRIGDMPTSVALKSYPQHICFAAGTLGCAQRNIARGQVETIHKIILTKPSTLLVYGPLRREYASVLDNWNVSYRVWNDYRTDSYAGKYKNRKAA